MRDDVAATAGTGLDSPGTRPTNPLAVVANGIPDRSPMPEAWDDAPYDGPPARSPRPWMDALDRCLEAGDLDRAAALLDEDGPNMRALRGRGMASWNARASIARGRLDLMRAYEAAHGAGCLLDATHRHNLRKAWARGGAEERRALEELHRRAAEARLLAG